MKTTKRVPSYADFPKLTKTDYELLHEALGYAFMDYGDDNSSFDKSAKRFNKRLEKLIEKLKRIEGRTE